ncbi:MAG: toll/interleukin-1 receptor domain-containing protein, partial [Methylocystis sp.]
MPTPSFFPYRAFISYSHRDKAWCDWLHRELERYRVSSDLVGRITEAGAVPRDLRPVFRDRADFSAGPLQAQSIEALKGSQFLIVIASPDPAASAYVNEEILLFKSFGGEDRVLSLIVAGEPPACFAPALRFRVGPDGALTDAPADQIGADIAKDGKREALVKIVAKLVGLPYDILWQRDVKAQRARWAVYAAAVVVALAAGAFFYTSVGLRNDVARFFSRGEQAAETRHEEVKHGQEELKSGEQELKRLVIDAAGGGAPAVKAIAEIRDILRPGNPEIDAISAEQLPKLVQRIIADLQKPAARAEDFTGAVKRALEQAQAQAGELKFVDAAKTLDEAIAKAQAEDQNLAKGRAALLAERGRVARLQLRYREAAGFYAKAAEATGFDPALSWGYAFEAANALYAQGDEFGENAALSESIQSYRSALNLAPRERVPLQWAATQNNLGNALERLGTRKSGTARLQQAVAAFHAALEERTRERVPLDWAMTQNNLGNALARLGERESGTARLEEAVSAYRAALEEMTRQRVPLGWATTQMNLGTALQTLGERESGTARLEEAVSAYRAALEEMTRQRVPLDWAMTQMNLGNALYTLGARESGTARLQEAVVAYRAALEERTRERVPLDWAMTQNNLGNALARLGERESG